MGQVQLCQKSDECPNGDHCVPFFGGFRICRPPMMMDGGGGDGGMSDGGQPDGAMVDGGAPDAGDAALD
jgi:hypothetical protein